MTQIPTLTNEDIAKGRAEAESSFAAAKAQYDAKMAYFDAAEHLDRVINGAARPVERRKRIFIEPSVSPETFDILTTIKDKILLSLHLGATRPSAIAAMMSEHGAVDLEYPPSHVSPKLNAYRDDGLVSSGDNGWTITEKGLERLMAAIQKHKGPDHAV